MNRNTFILFTSIIFSSSFMLLPNTNLKGQLTLNWQKSVDPWLLEAATQKDEIDFIVFLHEQADLSAADQIFDKVDKGTFVYESLTSIATSTQPPIYAQLEEFGVQYRPFWIANMILVTGNAHVLETLAVRPDVAHIYANPATRQALPQSQPILQRSPFEPSIPWHIDLIGAPDVWDLGFRGQGVVVGGQDTGYDWEHPALVNAYRGSGPEGLDHNYNWHDAIHNGPVTCGPDSRAPCDGHGHGTHTMGTMVGDDGAGEQIGMAPSAKWIGCRNMNDQGVGTPATYIECFQWFIAPTDLDGNNPDPEKAPDVINNSWSCPVSEGCTDPAILQKVVENVQKAGILTVQSAGNNGPGCRTVNTPAAIYDASFSVGATTEGDVIWYGSSRGPVTVDGSNRLKPDVTAPGQRVYSSIPNGGYAYLTGTSMAGPHVAGLAALLISSQPSLAGDVDSLEGHITISASPKKAIEDCGNIPGEQIPNNTYGYGRIDAYKALFSALSLESRSFFPILSSN